MEPTDRVRVAAEQLARMRGMTALYHKRFFADVRFTLVLILALLAAGFWELPEMFLVIPFVALWGAVQTAFDASYLLFARHYAAALEGWINRYLGEDLLVAGRLEDAYLFPLNARKVVTIAVGGPVTWFGLVTAITTLGGTVAAATGLWLGWEVLADASAAAMVTYLVTLAFLLALAFAVGWWWFVGGAGERRLAAVLAPLNASDGR